MYFSLFCAEFELRFTGFYRLATLIFIHLPGTEVFGGLFRPPRMRPQINITRVSSRGFFSHAAHLRHAGIMYRAWPEKKGEHVQLFKYPKSSFLSGGFKCGGLEPKMVKCRPPFYIIEAR